MPDPDAFGAFSEKSPKSLSEKKPIPKPANELNSGNQANSANSKNGGNGNGHFKNQVPETLVPEIEETAKWIDSKIPGRGRNRFNVFSWIQKNLRNHPAAILHVLGRVRKMLEENGPDSIQNVWAFADSILRVESQNFHEKDHMGEHQKRKGELAEVAELFQQLGINK